MWHLWLIAHASIDISGNKALKTEQLLESLDGVGINEGEVYKRSTLEKVKSELVRSYASNGRYGAGVEIKEVPQDIEPEDIKKINFRKRRARSDNTVGVTFARLGNYSMAIDYFKKAVENDEDELDYKVNLAVSLYRMYQYEEAISYYDEVKRAKPELVTQLDFIESRGEITPKFEKFD